MGCIAGDQLCCFMSPCRTRTPDEARRELERRLELFYRSVLPALSCRLAAESMCGIARTASTRFGHPERLMKEDVMNTINTKTAVRRKEVA